MKMKGENNWKESINNKDKWKTAWNREWARLDKYRSNDQNTNADKREREQKRFAEGPAIPINS